ncbi:uncharacterized protein B0T23DRAFT_246653 [Neurospora hispaniola]|uniref:Uncharacterized protein n=1 Tax=Neurospora hispaniola TaxID=588809 RepID=A0AAJ0HZW6_9PEZI|nr:hypothetical protein B0T23DRAFT_246653 [Neurospora hispaniola]
MLGPAIASPFLLAVNSFLLLASFFLISSFSFSRYTCRVVPAQHSPFRSSSLQRALTLISVLITLDVLSWLQQEPDFTGPEDKLGTTMNAGSYR